VTLQALAAALGGAQSIHTNSRDEALGLPTAESAQLALRTQQILAYESGITDTIDPLGGAPYVEYLCDQIESGVLEYARRVEAMGGMLAAIEKGFVQEEIRLAAYEHQRLVESGDRVVVGVNKFRVEHEAEPEVFRPDGSRCHPLCRNVVLEDGCWQGELPLALSDPPGKWRVEAREVVSGSIASTAVRVKK